MKKLKKLLKFMCNDEVGLVSTLFVLFAISAALYFSPVELVPWEIYNPVMLLSTIFSISFAVRLFIVEFKEYLKLHGE